MVNKTKNLNLVNDSNYRGNQNWSWNVWLEGPEEEINNVESVTYHLHPTFSNPVHRVTNKSSKFKLSGMGWGEFKIKAEVALADRATMTFNHWLKFDTMEKDKARQSVKGTIFLSHSNVDGPVANRLAAKLITKGYRVTASAMMELSAGADWQNEISKNIELADFNVVLISSGISEYIGTVISSLLSTDKAIREKIFPVLLGSAEVPELISDIQILRIGSMNELDTVVEEIEDLFKGSKA